MRLELRAKWLQYLFNKNGNQGFTLIELLVVIVIVGTLAFMALPSFLTCAKKSNQSEAKTYITSMNKGQQAYFVEKETFTNSIEKLGIGIKTKTDNYQYSIQTTTKTAFNYGVALKNTTKPIKSYVGGVFLVPVNKGETKAAEDEMEIVAILCESNTASTTRPTNPIYQQGVPTCGANTRNPFQNR